MNDDRTNLAAIGAACLVVLVAIAMHPDNAAMTLASTLVGGCIGYLQRRSVP